MGKQKGLITKGRYELKYRGTACLNCGQPLDRTDKYCPNCSQPNSTKKLTLKDFFDEFLSSLINYDSKLLKTLYTMMVKPGTITKDYINGRRISYTNPFRFLFSLAFLYFLMFAYTSNLSKLDKLNLDEKIQEEGNFNFSLDGENQVLDSLGKPKKLKDIVPLDSLSTEEPEVAAGLKQLDSLDALIAKVSENERKADSLMKANPKGYMKQLQEKGDDSFTNQIEFYISLIRKDSLSTFEEAQQKYGAKSNLKSRFAFRASDSILRAIKQPGSWLNDTISKLPFVIFFFLPVFTIFILLAYVRKNYTYTDHLIFSFHNQSLLFILLILSWIIDIIFKTSTVGLAFVLFATYLFQAMRKFYGQGIFKTTIKYVFLNAVFTFLATIAVVLLSLGSAVTY